MTAYDSADLRPVDPVTGEPLPQMVQPGYYPGFDTLAQRAFWDAATRDEIERRLDSTPPIRFFQGGEVPLITAIMARIIPQDDRDEAHRIPVVNFIDERLYSGRTDGYRFDDMPPDSEAYHLGLQGIEAVAQAMYDRSFVALNPTEQDEALWTLHQDKPPGGADIWKQVPCDRFWLMLVSDAVDAYYRHPYVWNEIGFGGPAYPRGYFRLENGQPEPWEVEERPYNWAPPATSTSGSYRQLGGRHPHRAPAGQEGTH